MLRVITNSVPRFIVDVSELTHKERTEFNYIDWVAVNDGAESASFFRYRGKLYDIGEFSTTWGLARDSGLPSELAGWHGFMSDSFFSGMVVRYVDNDCESVVVGRFYA